MSDFNPPMPDNPEKRCPVVLLLDRSASMEGEPIKELNDALIVFQDSIKKQLLTSLRVEVAIITFGGTVQVYDCKTGLPLPDTNIPGKDAFTTAIDFQAPQLTPNGQTPMGTAVELGLRLLRERKDYLRQVGLNFYRPWMILITDGNPTDNGVWQRAAELSKQEENKKGFIFYGIGVKGADMAKLSKFSDQRAPLMLKGLDFRELFLWLSNSLGTVTQETSTMVTQTADGVGEQQVSLPSVAGWAQIDTSAN